MLLPRRCIAAGRYLRWPAFHAAPAARAPCCKHQRSCCQSVPAADLSIATTIDQNSLYATPIPQKLSFHASIKLAQVPGKGRGVISTADLDVGHLLAVIPAAAILHGPVDDRPSAAELINHIQAAYTANAITTHQSQAIAALYDGTDESLQQLPDINTLLPTVAEKAASASATAAAPERLPQIVALNAFGDQYEDLAAATVKDADPSSQIGIWPLFAMFNHSCAPNTIHYVVGEHLVVRAVQKVPEGEEVTVSYLGRQEFAPAALRNQHLQESHGFTCNCPRCAAEQRYSPQLTAALQQIHVQVTQHIKPGYDALKAAGETTSDDPDAPPPPLTPDQQQLKADLDAQVTAAIIQLHDALKSDDFSGSPFGMAYAQAAVFDLLELQAANQEPGSNAALAAATTCITALDAVCRGAELHCMLSAKLLQDVMERMGAEGDAAAAAAQLCQIAHVARYGDVSEDLMSELVQMHIYMAEEYVK